MIGEMTHTGGPPRVKPCLSMSITSTSRWVQVEGSLGEAVVELRGKMQEMEQMKALVYGLLMALQSAGGGGGGGGARPHFQ